MTDEEIWNNDAIMAANAQVGLPLDKLAIIVRAALAAPSSSATPTAPTDPDAEPVLTRGTTAIVNAWNDLPDELRLSPHLCKLFDAVKTCRDVDTPTAQQAGADGGAVARTLTDQQCAAQLAMMKTPPMKDGSALHDWACDVMRAGYRLATPPAPPEAPATPTAEAVEVGELQEQVDQLVRVAKVGVAHVSDSMGPTEEDANRAIDRLRELALAARPAAEAELLARIEDLEEERNEAYAVADQYKADCEELRTLASEVGTRPAAEAAERQGLTEGWTHRHIRRGGLYRELHRGFLQTDVPLTDMMELVVYQGEDGRVWLRPVSEFDDDERFAALARAGGEGAQS